MEVMPAVRALAERFGLPDGAEETLARLVDVVASDPHAPTTVRAPLAVVEQHLADSLTALEVGRFRALRRIVDIGCGAGFPGAPLAAAMPPSCFDLLESSARKCAFAERLIVNAGLRNARAVHARAEEWGAGSGAAAYDGATARALGPPAVVLEYAASLLEVGGLLYVWRGRRIPSEEEAARSAADQLGMALVAAHKVEPFAGSRNRHIHVYEKLSDTPRGFPRRPGVAAKRPLGLRAAEPASGEAAPL
jgi:16S rRNA (guanine527-N7)-methyltransferase